MQHSLHLLTSQILEILHTNPSMMLFLIIGLGYLIGRIGFGGFSFGPVAGVLFAGLFFGHFGFRMAEGPQIVGFSMFIFSVGYQAGPSFFSVLKEDGARYMLLALVVASSGFVVAVIGASLLSLQPGMSAGLLAGGLTSSPTLAAAQEAVRDGVVTLPEGWSREAVINNVATGYAITYIFGLAGLITILKLLPRWLGIDLAAEAQRMSSEARETGAAPVNVTTRCYRVTNEEMTRVPISKLRDTYWDQVTVANLVRNGQQIPVKADEYLQVGDRLEFMGPRSFFVEAAHRFGEEVPPKWRIRDVTDTAQIVVLNREVVGKKLVDIDIPRRFGLLLVRIMHLGVEIPHSADIELSKGDILTVVGNAAQIDALGDHLGYVERDIAETDMVTFAFGIVFGVLVGMLSIEVGGVSIGLGSAGGLLAAGLAISYLRSRRPTFGRLPDAAQWFLMEFGLLLFMTGVGLRAGSNIIETLLSAGPLLILAGVFVTVVPILVGYWFGSRILKIRPVLLFGAITGAMTSGASLAVVTGAARSALPALGYTGTYAFANVLLMVAGSLILMF
jgi:putative transport protein